MLDRQSRRVVAGSFGKGGGHNQYDGRGRRVQRRFHLRASSALASRTVRPSRKPDGASSRFFSSRYPGNVVLFDLNAKVRRAHGKGKRVRTKVTENTEGYFLGTPHFSAACPFDFSRGRNKAYLKKFKAQTLPD